jgi:hypothetical protein
MWNGHVFWAVSCFIYHENQPIAVEFYSLWRKSRKLSIHLCQNPFAKLQRYLRKKALCNRLGRFIAPVAYLLSAPNSFDLQTMQFSPKHCENWRVVRWLWGRVNSSSYPLFTQELKLGCPIFSHGASIKEDGVRWRSHASWGSGST